MAIQLSDSVRDARLDAIETDIGTAAVLRIFTGAQPANCAAANSGTELANMTLPTDWMAAASGGTKSKLGTWQELSSIDTGTAAHFRLYASDGTTCHLQGSVGQGSGDLQLDNTSIASGQQITVTQFDLTDANS